MSENEISSDAIYQRSLSELKWILIAWAISCTWVVGYCFVFGYEVDPANLDLVIGMPAWVFWGVLLPWCLSTAFTIWFSLFQMTDQPLPQEPDTIHRRSESDHHVSTDIDRTHE
ncbi:DUF997 domain-containing protein [Planctomycetes bacterium K23_9]|uniref:Uncharacterized protein n=1 Tax=Stieleria marina TaxID=1930275 RepID=A0A517P1L4_9BACT|nr:hypothetical protein K239x_52790 [Planctomycetes bacterium K23_9]